MKSRAFLYLISFFCLSGAQFLLSEPVITFFLHPYPLEQEQDSLTIALQKPGKIAKHTVYGTRMGQVAGIMATYRGFLEVSDDLGQISFPRDHENPTVPIVFAHKLIPIMMAGNTVHHWELEPETPAVQYLAQRFQDSTTKQFLWNITLGEIPSNRRIGLNTLVIFVKPKHVFIPEGVSLTQNSPNLLLPPLYVKKGAKQTAETLYLLNLKHLFGQVRHAKKEQADRYETHVVR